MVGVGNKKGSKKTAGSGRKKGTPNKVTPEVRLVGSALAVQAPVC